MLDTNTTNGRIIDAALKAAAAAPWSDVTLPDIAKSAGVSLVELRRAFGSKGEILAAFVRAVDDEVLARSPLRTSNSTESARDALFEVIMARLDVLAPYKPALKSINASWNTDRALLAALANSQTWMLHAAGIPADGIGGGVRSAGLGAVYASAFRTWLQDDDPGLARTMASLDRRLRRGERALNSLEEVRSKLAGFTTAFRGPHKRASGDATTDVASAPERSPPASA